MLLHSIIVNDVAYLPSRKEFNPSDSIIITYTIVKGTAYINSVDVVYRFIESTTCQP